MNFIKQIFSVLIVAIAPTILSAQDTTAIANIKIDTILNDSLVLDSAQSLVTKYSTILDSISQDTLPHPWINAGFKLGLGWMLGKVYPLTLWSNFNPNKSSYYINRPSSDTTNLTFDILEKPSSYSVAFPFQFSYAFKQINGFNLSISSAYYKMSRKYRATAKENSTKISKWNSERKITYRELMIGATISKNISEEFFSVNRVDELAVEIGLFASPLLQLIGYNNDTYETNNDFKAYGTGISWRVGILARKEISKKQGIEVGLSYLGSWTGHIMKDGLFGKQHLLENDLKNGNSVNSPYFTYITHRMILYFNFIIPKKIRDLKVQEKNEH